MRTQSFSLLLVAALLGTSACTSLAAPVVLDIQPYRTQVSPGTIDEDLMILRNIIPELARRTGFVSSRRRRFEPETLELRRSLIPQPGPAENGGLGTSHRSNTRLVVNGNRYYQAAETYLKWRKVFEEKWIESHASGWEPRTAPRTPLQAIFEDPGLDKRGKALAMLRVYSQSSSPAGAANGPAERPTPTPSPEFWPVSDVIEIPEVNGSVQINMRGGKVVVLDRATGQASLIPFDSFRNPREWLVAFRKQALQYGLAGAVKNELDKVPRISKERPAVEPHPAPPPDSATVVPEHAPRIPWGE